jgi:hypothetical protein
MMASRGHSMQNVKQILRHEKMGREKLTLKIAR